MSESRKTGAVAIVPVRVDSQRLPGKALLTESGQPLFLHTCAQALRAECFDQVIVATDSDAVAAAALAVPGLEAMMTSPDARTGSERCAEAAGRIDCAAVVDIQGDWPEVHPDDLRKLVDALAAHRDADDYCVTLGAPLHDPERITDPNVVKIARGVANRALYFSRLPIPFRRDPAASPAALRHIGVYGFTRATMLRVPDLPSSGLDEVEGLEQLRFLENRISIEVLDATGDPWGIECREDYDAFLQRLT